MGLFVVFLMSYVNSYMLRRKQKEFAIETIIGMEKKTVAFLFFLETSVMGAAAILLGVLLGMLLSQIISVIVVQSFGENNHLHLSLFPDTFLGTVIFFGTSSLPAHRIQKERAGTIESEAPEREDRKRGPKLLSGRRR